MAIYDYCPAGGMNGIRVSDAELSSLADAIGSNALDSCIPLPNLTQEQQIRAIEDCQGNHENEEYWERDNGKHGWCCGNCGTVVQWG